MLNLHYFLEIFCIAGLTVIPDFYYHNTITIGETLIMILERTLAKPTLFVTKDFAVKTNLLL